MAVTNVYLFIYHAFIRYHYMPMTKNNYRQVSNTRRTLVGN